jgi:DNA-binding transcriptional ArsR family regulator
MNSDSKAVKVDNMFDALANEKRRNMILELAYGPRTISQLAKREHLSLQAIHKHIDFLEEANLVKRRKEGTSNYLTLNAAQLFSAQRWLMQFNTHWYSTKQNLENYKKFLSNKA